MTASELLLDIYRIYRGKIDSRAPAWGSDKANVAISIANRKQREWATDPRNKWNSLFENRAITPVVDALTTPTLTYDLGTDFFAPSDFARVVKTDGSYVEYPVVKPQQRNDSDQSLYIHGSNPKQVTFSQTIDTSLDGGTLYVPGYFLLADITDSTDVILVDDPNWLSYSVAAELARNDPAKDAEYPNIVGMANDLYSRMSNANNDVGYGQPNAVNSFMPSVGSSTSEDWTA